MCDKNEDGKWKAAFTEMHWWTFHRQMHCTILLTVWNSGAESTRPFCSTHVDHWPEEIKINEKRCMRWKKKWDEQLRGLHLISVQTVHLAWGTSTEATLWQLYFKHCTVTFSFDVFFFKRLSKEKRQKVFQAPCAVTKNPLIILFGCELIRIILSKIYNYIYQ